MKQSSSTGVVCFGEGEADRNEGINNYFKVWPLSHMYINNAQNFRGGKRYDGMKTKKIRETNWRACSEVEPP